MANPDVDLDFDFLRLAQIQTRMKASTSLLRPLRETAYGKYDVLRPLRSRAGRKPASFVRPLPVPLSIIRPSYVPVNFWSRNSDDEKLVIDDEFEDLEGWKGDSGIGESSLGIGMIPLGGVEERTIRHVARIASEVLRDVETLIQVSPQVRHVVQYS